MPLTRTDVVITNVTNSDFRYVRGKKKKKDGADSRGLDMKPDMKTFSFSSAIALKRATWPTEKCLKKSQQISHLGFFWSLFPFLCSGISDVVIRFSVLN